MPGPYRVRKLLSRCKCRLPSQHDVLEFSKSEKKNVLKRETEQDYLRRKNKEGRRNDYKSTLYSGRGSNDRFCRVALPTPRRRRCRCQRLRSGANISANKVDNLYWMVLPCIWLQTGRQTCQSANLFGIQAPRCLQRTPLMRWTPPPAGPGQS